MNITISSNEFKNYSKVVRNALIREAVFVDCKDLVCFLLEAEADLEEGMIASVISKNIKMLHLFLEKGADVTYKDNTAFSLAACDGDYEVAKILIEAGASPKIDILHAPLNEGHYKIFELEKSFKK